MLQAFEVLKWNDGVTYEQEREAFLFTSVSKNSNRY